MGFTVETGISAAAVFVQGLLSFFSPCVLPLVPLYLGYLAGGLNMVSDAGKAAGLSAGSTAAPGDRNVRGESRRRLRLFLRNLSQTAVIREHIPPQERTVRERQDFPIPGEGCFKMSGSGRQILQSQRNAAHAVENQGKQREALPLFFGIFFGSVPGKREGFPEDLVSLWELSHVLIKVRQIQK